MTISSNIHSRVFLTMSLHMFFPTFCAGNSITMADNISTIFTWKVENFSTLIRKHCSDIFRAGGVEWRLVIYPKGDNVDKFSVGLTVADSANLPRGWSTYVQFYLSVVDQLSNRYTMRKDALRKFNARENEWGFWFMPLSELLDSSKGFLLNDTFLVKAGVSAGKVVEDLSYDSKKETGYIGLQNQGATSCMNSLLQTLYHIPCFRMAIYRIPTAENDVPSRSISLALKSLFFELQYSHYSVATEDLIKSFGWNTNDSFMQNDVQELNRLLCEKLEDKIKGTFLEGTILELFEGHHMRYLECTNVNYASKRKESFHGLLLDVKGCRDVYASLDKYVSIEHLEGDNKYCTEQHGLQEARKGVLFIDFPPVLQIQLKRFEYDFIQETMVKINDRYEFPLELDLNKGNGKYLSPDSDWKASNLFMLHSVLVHNGGEHGGRYHVFVRPTFSGQWSNFDDERVTKEDVDRAVKEQFGGEIEVDPEFSDAPSKSTKASNAYMLVYIRKTDMDNIMCNTDGQYMAGPLWVKLKKKQELKDQKKKKAHLYITIKVVRNEDLVQHTDRDSYFDIVDHDKVRCFQVHKWLSFSDFKEEVAKEFGIPVQFQRFWLWAKRKNHAYRPNRPLAPDEERQSVGQLAEFTSKAHSAKLRLFLEVELGPDMYPIKLPSRSSGDLMLFFKLYDPMKEDLCYVGRLLVKGRQQPSTILTKLNELAGFLCSQQIKLYEETKSEPNVKCTPIDTKLRFRNSQLEDGDIVYFQKSYPVGSEQLYRYPDVPSFLEYLHNRLVVHFRSLKKPNEDVFCLELSKLSVYDEVVERVAAQLGVHDPTKIKLTPHNRYPQKPDSNPIEYRAMHHLADLLINSNQTSGILYYKVMGPKAGPRYSEIQPIIPSCTICLDAPLEGACIPCGHLAGCMSCLKVIKDKGWPCPICRSRIEQVVRIYST